MYFYHFYLRLNCTVYELNLQGIIAFIYIMNFKKATILLENITMHNI
jgi:hypothetical protein